MINYFDAIFFRVLSDYARDLNAANDDDTRAAVHFEFDRWLRTVSARDTHNVNLFSSSFKYESLKLYSCFFHLPLNKLL